MCSCNSRYQLNADNKTFTFLGVCAASNGNCSDICTDVNGTAVCSCKPGFRLGLDNKTCAGFLPFLTFGATSSVLKGTDDGYSDPVYAAQGIPIGTSIQTQAYVGANGIISFQAGWTSNIPQLFPTNNIVTKLAYIVAPFWSDNDLRLAGNVTYQVYGLSSQLINASTFIADMTGTNFSGTWMLVAQWNGAHPYPHGNSPTSPALQATNTYQAIVITDGLQSYAIFTYNCQQLQWVQSQSNYAVVGFNAYGESYANANFSGTPLIGSIACNNSTYPWSNAIYNIGKSTSITQNQIRSCILAYYNDITLFGATSPTAYIQQPCPCVHNQLLMDSRFTPDHKQTSYHCYYQTLARRIKSTYPVRYCCYDLTYGALLPQMSTPLLFHPTKYPVQYQQYDVSFQQACCDQAGLCNLYTKRRGPDYCYNYRPQRLSWGNGDPHFTTLDGKTYTFNGWGEYMVFQQQLDTDFVFQARTSPVVNTSATQFVAFAFGTQSADYVEVDAPNGSITAILVNGSNVTNNLTSVGSGFTAQTVSITTISNNSIQSTFENGISVTVSVVTSLLTYSIAVSSSQNITGMLGNYNGNPDDDFILPYGTMLPSNASDRQLFVFGQSYQISSSESLFTYLKGYSAANYSHPTYIPAFLEDVLANASNTIKMACSNDSSCIFDYSQTGSMAIGLGTLNTNTQNNINNMISFSFPPNITGPAVFLINTSVVSVYYFTVNTTNQFTISVIGNLPGILTNNGGGLYSFSTNYSNITNATVAFLVNDTLGSASVLTPQLQICACINGGTCTTDGILNVNQNPLLLNCQCSQAWTGNFCELDYNGCLDLTCFPGVNCTDARAPAIGARCGPCPAGYYTVNNKCQANVCAINNGGCSQICNSTIANYTCSCMTGYKLGSDGSTCTDINECQNAQICNQDCTNTNGSYFCSCKPGSLLNTDMKTCTAFSPTINAVVVTLAGYTVDSFTSDVRTKFVNTVESIFSTYCTNGMCSRQATNSQYLVTIRDISNGAAGLVITLQVQSSSSVLSATIVVQALTASSSIFVANGFTVVSIAPYSGATSGLSGGAIAGIIVAAVATTVIAVVVAVFLAVLFKSCRRKRKYDIATGDLDAMTMKTTEHIVIDNEHAATTIKMDDEFGDVSSVHLTYEEPPAKESTSSTNGIVTAAANNDITSTNEKNASTNEIIASANLITAL